MGITDWWSRVRVGAEQSSSGRTILDVLPPRLVNGKRSTISVGVIAIIYINIRDESK